MKIQIQNKIKLNTYMSMSSWYSNWGKKWIKDVGFLLFSNNNVGCSLTSTFFLNLIKLTQQYGIKQAKEICNTLGW